MPLIHDNLKRHTAPPWLRPTVERLLASLSPEHLAGIDAIVLSDSEAVGKGKTRRVGKRKYARRQCLGFYHPASRTQAAWVELVIDNVVPPAMPRSLLWFQLVRDMRVAKTLYHEIGHHLHETVGSATRGGELAAEDWRRRLSRIHFRRKYWLLRPFILLLRKVVHYIRNARRALVV